MSRDVVLMKLTVVQALANTLSGSMLPFTAYVVMESRTVAEEGIQDGNNKIMAL